MNSVGINKTENIGQNEIQTIGLMKNLSVGANFMTNVTGSLQEFVKGKRESKATEVKENSKKRQIISQDNNDIHSQSVFNNNSGENSKMQ